MYFIDEHGEDYRTGQIIAQISDGYYLAQFDCTHDNVPPPPLEVLSSADFNKVCDNRGSRHWQFFADVETRKRWITWLTNPIRQRTRRARSCISSPSQINRREVGYRAFHGPRQILRVRRTLGSRTIARTLDETSVRWAAILGKAQSILLEGRASEANGNLLHRRPLRI
jgi:hypothetical protein